MEKIKYDNYEEINKKFISFQKKFKNNHDDYFSFDTLLDEFNIDRKFFASLSKMLKIEFLKEKIKEKFNRDLKDIEEKYKRNKTNYQFKNKNKNKKKIFDWLNYKTKYPFLKNIILSNIVQFIGQKNNSDIFDKIAEKFDQEKKKDPSYLYSDFKYNYNFFKYKNNYIDNENKISIKKNSNYIMIDKYNLNLANKFNWNRKVENKYKRKLSVTKNKLSRYTKSSNYLDTVLFEILNLVKSEDTSQDKRDFLLKKYLDGNPLDLQEIRYLAFTSDTLNLFLNKKYYQKIVNLIDRDILDDIELSIANKIIEEYYFVKKLFLKSRKVYLSSVNTKIKKKIMPIPEKKSIKEEVLLKQKRNVQKFLTRIIKNNLIIDNTNQENSLKKNIFKESEGTNNDEKKINPIKIILENLNNVKKRNVVNKNLTKSNVLYKKIFPKQSQKWIFKKQKSSSSKILFDFTKIRDYNTTGPCVRKNYWVKSKKEVENNAKVIQKYFRSKQGKFISNNLKIQKNYNLIH